MEQIKPAWDQIVLLGERWLLQVINLSITGSVVILAILLMRLALKRAPRRFAYLLWSAAAFRLLSPVSFNSVISLLHLNVFRQAALLGDRLDSLTYVPAILEPAQVVSVAGSPVTEATVNPLPVISQATAAVPAQTVLTAALVIWLVGMFALLCYGLIAYGRVRRLVAGSVLLSGRVYETDKIATPFILGLFRPRIFLPFRLAETERSYILQHEHYHLRHGDHLIKLLSCLVVVIHWFNPLVWLACHRMHSDMEMRCDEAILRQRGQATRQAYSTSLLALATHSRLSVINPLAFGESNVRRRVRHILNFRKPQAWLLTVALLVCLATLIVLVANPPLRSDPVSSADRPALEEAVHQAIVIETDRHYSDDRFTAEANTILKTVSTGDRVTVYAVVMYQRYTFDQQGIVYDSGAHGPIALTFRKTTERTYRLLEYWTPEWGDYYGPSIRRKFPADIAADAINTYAFSEQHRQSCEAQIQQHYASWLASATTAMSPTAIPAKVHSLSAGTERVADFLALADQIGFSKLPGYYADDTCYNVTPHEVYRVTGCLIFKYEQSAESYLQLNDQIYMLGVGFGGYGLTDIQLCDFDANGRYELLYSYSWGSGIHRSHIAHFDPDTAVETVLDFVHWSGNPGDLYLEKRSDDHFMVYTADVAIEANNFARIRVTRHKLLAEIQPTAGKIDIKPVS